MDYDIRGLRAMYVSMGFVGDVDDVAVIWLGLGIDRALS